MAAERDGNRELALPPGVFAFMQDCTKGGIKTYVGPIVINQTGQERPVIYNAAQRLFQPVALENAVVKNIIAGEGDYIVLENPPENSQQPKEGGVENAVNLRLGMKVNIPGPCAFALWPTQAANVIAGHTLRSNQYLVARVYNSQEAVKNWDKAIAKKTDSKNGDKAPVDLTIGTLFNIKGTEVSGFYVPPTGIEVVKDSGSQYVRDAVTLERLEYAICVNEQGVKRYEIGPQVVFPEPTEVFYVEDGCRKFKAEELTGIQGLHIKVIADYEENGIKYTTGQELFIKGDACAIYYPRPEHSIIQYGEKRKHYATAIPIGEGRYVLNRDTGEIRTEKGPTMLLPDPRHEVIVRRPLSEKECELWYPGNEEAANYNRSLRPLQSQGYVSENALLQNYGGGAQLEMLAATAPVARVAKMAMPDAFTRSTTYTPPRTVTLDTKFEGVPRISVWTGYAVMVVDKRGNRTPVQGPDTVLLDYDQTLEVLQLSTGKPKNTDTYYNTVYLRVSNNKVSDIIQIESKDHVPMSIKVSYVVNFEGDPTKWFDVENYVKYLCDHLRSMLKGAIRKIEIKDFYTDGAAIVREIILGKKDEKGVRPLARFVDNGMVVSDVEILGIKIEDNQIDKLLSDAQHEVVAQNIELDRSEKGLIVTRRKAEIARETAKETYETARLQIELDTAKTQQQLTLALSKITSQTQEAEEKQKVTVAQETDKDISFKSELARKQSGFEQDLTYKKAQSDLKLVELHAEVDSVVKRFGAAQAGFSEAVLAISRDETLTKVAQAASVQTWIGGKSLVEVLKNIFEGTNLTDKLKRISDGVTESLPAARR